MMKLEHSFTYSGLLLALCLIVSACTSPIDAPAATNPYFHEMEKYRKDVRGTPSEHIVLEILNDEKITDEEMQFLAQTQIKCMEDAGHEGYTINLETGVTEFPLSSSDAQDKRALEAQETCYNQTHFQWIQFLYIQIKTNPLNIPFEDVMAACLVKLKVVAPSYNGKEHRDHIDKWAKDTTKTDGEDPSYAVPYIVDQETGTEAYYRCNNDPQSILTLQ